MILEVLLLFVQVLVPRLVVHWFVEGCSIVLWVQQLWVWLEVDFALLVVSEVILGSLSLVYLIQA